jgi:transcriptional regulator with XRE-family HTH domain
MHGAAIRKVNPLRTRVIKYIEAHRRLGVWLKDKRLSAGLSQSQLAALIGRQTSFIGKYEAGQRLEVMEFFRIAKALEADVLEALNLVEVDR